MDYKNPFYPSSDDIQSRKDKYKGKTFDLNTRIENLVAMLSEKNIKSIYKK